ncbi:bifunctional pyr operon transcriptional regulator/uracil phosphoribosyltransferase PyrR [soil metagenome]
MGPMKGSLLPKNNFQIFKLTHFQIAFHYLCPMQPRVILNTPQFALTIDRLCYQLIENHSDFTNTVVIGIQPRGIFLSNRINERLKVLQPGLQLAYGKLDNTFYRDDFRRREKPLEASATELDFVNVEGKRVILVDDVLYTGRTIRAAMDALLDFGRPKQVELLVLIDRRYTRHLPIEANYVGKKIDSIASEIVRVEWHDQDGADKVWILTTNKEN